DRNPGDDYTAGRRVDLGDGPIRSVGDPDVLRGQGDRVGIRADLEGPNNLSRLRVDAHNGVFAAVRDPQRTEAVHQRVRTLSNLDGGVQGSVGVEDSDTVRWQGGQGVLRSMAQDDAGHHTG